MAFTKSTVATDNISNLPNKPLISATALKAAFDKYGADDKPYVNGLIDELEKTTPGSSGAENMGSATITGVTGNSIWTQLSDIASKLMNDFLSKTNTTAYAPTAPYHPATKKYSDDSIAGAIIGTLPLGSVTAPYIANDAVETDKIKNLAVTYEKLSSSVQGRFAMTDKAIAELLMIADIDSKVFSPNLNKFYTDFSAAMDYSMGTIDSTKQAFVGSLSAGASSVAVMSSTGFYAGQEISVQDVSNYEDIVLLSVVGNTLNFKTNLVNSYTNPTIYRSNNNATGFGIVSGWNELSANAKFYVALDSSATDAVASKTPSANTSTWDTTNKKFGTASAAFNGTQAITYTDGTYITLGSNNFIVDFWIKRGTIGTQQWTLGQCDASASNTTTSFIFHFTSGNIPTFSVGQTSSLVTVAGSAITDTASFHNIRLGRDGNFIRMWVDGTLQNSTAITGLINDSTNAFSLGQIGEFTTNRFNGNIDEFSITIGDSPGSSNYTPRTAPYILTGFATTKNVIRMNITPYEDVKYISAWLTKTDLAGFTADGKLSIVDASADESYVDLTESITDLGATQEVMMIGNSATADSKVTLKVELNRASTSDSVSFTKLIGGVSA